MKLIRVPALMLICNCWPAPRNAFWLTMSFQEVGGLNRSKFFSMMVMPPISPWKLLAPTLNMNRPVGASSTEVTTSANDRLGNGSLRSGPTLVMPMPGMLGNEAGGSPDPTGGWPGGGPTGPPSPPGAGPGAAAPGRRSAASPRAGCSATG